MLTWCTPTCQRKSQWVIGFISCAGFLCTTRKQRSTLRASNHAEATVAGRRGSQLRRAEDPPQPAWTAAVWSTSRHGIPEEPSCLQVHWIRWVYVFHWGCCVCLQRFPWNCWGLCRPQTSEPGVLLFKIQNDVLWNQETKPRSLTVKDCLDSF